METQSVIKKATARADDVLKLISIEGASFFGHGRFSWTVLSNASRIHRKQFSLQRIHFENEPDLKIYSMELYLSLQSHAMRKFQSLLQSFQ